MRAAADAPTQAVLVLNTLGAPERRRLRGRRGQEVVEAGAEPVPTARVTLVRPEPFESRELAEAWLDGLRAGEDGAAEEVDRACALLNRALHAHRVASADPHARDVTSDAALVVRVGFGGGDAVADGRFERAWELPSERRRTKRSMEAPDERFAALLGGRERALPAEELVLRARGDLDMGRTREAALEARVALEALLAELGQDQPAAGDRGTVGDAANAALRGDLPPELERALAEAVEHMEAALKRRRLGG